ncbi:MAG: integrase core domain-containing protein [Runella sp.]
MIAPAKPNQGWALDFLSELVLNDTGSWYRVLNVVDECSRRCLWLSAEKSITADKVVEVLEKLVAMRGKPAYIRTDNGPEYISQVLAQWADKNGIEQRHIQPGKPTQNGIIERLNGTLRRECLNLHWFKTKAELDKYLEKWFIAYNFNRPHSSLQFLTPVQFENNFFSTFNLVA